MQSNPHYEKALLKLYPKEFLPPWPATAIVLDDQNKFENSFITQSGDAILTTPGRDFLVFQSPAAVKNTIKYLKRLAL